MLLQKDEAQQEGSRIRSFYHVRKRNDSSHSLTYESAAASTSSMLGFGFIPIIGISYLDIVPHFSQINDSVR